MSIDNATPEEWHRAAYLGRLAAESAAADLTPRDIEALNRVLDRSFGEVPLVARAYVFLLHQMGKVHITSDNDYTRNVNPCCWYPYGRYQVRAVEKPKTKPSIDWSQIKPEYKWLARDEDDTAYVYIAKPVPSPQGTWFAAGEIGILNHMASYIPGDCDWKDSLVERPA